MSKSHLRVHSRQITEPKLQIRTHECDANPKHTPCYLLLEDYEFVDDFTFDEPVKLHTPAGFHHDGASIPKRIHGIIDSYDLSITAPFLHDVIYRYCGNLPAGWITPARTYTRAQGDFVFRAVMDLEGVPAMREWAGYEGVRLCGWKAWGDNASQLARQRAEDFLIRSLGGDKQT